MKPRKTKTKKELVELLQFIQKHLVDDGNGGKCIRIMIAGKDSQNDKTLQLPNRENKRNDINDHH